MKQLTELNSEEIAAVAGGAHPGDVSARDALFVSVGTVAGMLISYYICDPIIDYIFGLFGKSKKRIND